METTGRFHGPWIRHADRHIQLMEQCDAYTLLPIIRQVVAVSTEIWLDEWHAHN